MGIISIITSTTVFISKFSKILQDFVPTFLENLTDDELKKEAKNEAKNDALSSIIKVFFKKILSAEFFVKSLTPSLTFFHMATW